MRPFAILLSFLSLVAAQTSEVGTAAPSATVTTASSQATTAITISGNAFFRGSDRFYIRGVDYQPGGSSSTVDPLSVTSNCERDIPYMQKLGINTIRVYQVDNSANHDACMALLQKAGIYLVLDVNTATYSLSRSNPSASYNAIYLQHIFATIDAFKGYTNTLGFFAGNEVVNDDATVSAATWVKATVRDMKAYIAAQSSRSIGVGYSAADVENNRVALANYFNCGNASTRADFYAYNNYEWCGSSSFTQSGWNQRVAELANYSIPLFFSEFGCNAVQPRSFSEIAALYNTEMTNVFSGGLVYEWSQEASYYGLVNVVSSSSIELYPDYNNLLTAYQTTPNPTGNGGYSTTNAVSSCPANTSTFSGVWAQDVLPSTPSAALAYIKSGAGTALGNSGPTNQDAGANAVLSGSQTASRTTTSTSSARASATTTSTKASGSASASASASSSSTTKSAGVKLESGLTAGLLGVVLFASFGMLI